LQKKVWRDEVSDFATFAGVFQGGSVKSGVLAWSLSGENVVQSVVERGC
jgi:hypothetical protein